MDWKRSEICLSMNTAARAAATWSRFWSPQARRENTPARNAASLACKRYSALSVWRKAGRRPRLVHVPQAPVRWIKWDTGLPRGYWPEQDFKAKKSRLSDERRLPGIQTAFALSLSLSMYPCSIIPSSLSVRINLSASCRSINCPGREIVTYLRKNANIIFGLNLSRGIKGNFAGWEIYIKRFDFIAIRYCISISLYM